MTIGLRSAVFLSIWMVICLLETDGRVLPVEPLSEEDAISTRSFPLQAPISLSADGSWVAYTLQQTARAAETSHGNDYFSPAGTTWLADGAEVWIANTRTQKQFQISDPKSSGWSPSWSPNGRLLAFFSDKGGVARLWVWNQLKQRAEVVGDAQVHPFALHETPKWSPDSRFVFAKTLSPSTDIRADHKPNLRASEASVRVFESTSDNRAVSPDSGSQGYPSFLNGYRGDLSRFDLRTGKVDRLAIDKKLEGWWVSPIGQYLAFTEIDGLENGNADLLTYTLWVVDLKTQAVRPLERQVPLVSGLTISWSPDGKKLAYLTGGNANFKAPPVECYVVDLDDRKGPLKITTALRPSSADFFRPPRWSQYGKSILLMDPTGVYVYGVDGCTARLIRPQNGRTFVEFLSSKSRPQIWSDDGMSFYVYEQDKETLDVEVHRLNISNDSDARLSREAMALPLYPVLQTEGSDDGSTLVYLAQSSDSPLDIWVADRGFAHHGKLTTTNPQLADRRFGKSRLISWRSIDGQELHGALLLPPDFDRGTSVPLVVDVYGGDFRSQHLNVFGLHMGGGPLNEQLLATRGFAVLFPDAPMGTATPALDVLKDVMPGIDKVIELGIARSDAIAVMGESYGGYSTLSLLMQTNRFRAAIAVAPISDLFDVYSLMDDAGSSFWLPWAEQSQGRMQGTPWQYRDKYIENSPFFFADRINTPVLLVHGGADEIAKGNCRKMFVALRRLGKTAEYREYLGGKHLPEFWNRDQQLDFARRMIAWFDHYLKGTPSP